MCVVAVVAGIPCVGHGFHLPFLWGLGGELDGQLDLHFPDGKTEA